MGLEINGIEQLMRRVNSLGSRGEDIVDDALRVGATILRNEVRNNLNTTSDTGELKKSIKISPIKLDGGGTKFIAVKQGSKVAWYGAIIEKGARNRYTKPKSNKRYHTKRKYTGKIQATHFMERAKDSKQDEVMETITRMIQEGLTN